VEVPVEALEVAYLEAHLVEQLGAFEAYPE
jgi:hypothetical protein